MTQEEQPTPNADLKRIMESAHRLGIELDEEEALQWMTELIALKSLPGYCGGPRYRCLWK